MLNAIRTVFLASLLGLAVGIGFAGTAYAYDGEIDVPGTVDVQPDERDPWEVESVQAGVSADTFMYDGVVYDGSGRRYTWYSEHVLPGDGLTELNANGRTVDESGYIVDGDGYIAIASPWGIDPIGTVIATPFGMARVYDVCEDDSYDVYTSW